MSDDVYILFSPQHWNSQHSRTRAFALGLAKSGIRTIYVNPPGSVAGIVRESVAALVNPLRRENVRFPVSCESLEVWSPPVVPTFYRGSVTPSLDRRLFTMWFEKRLATITGSIIAVIAMPYWWDGYLNTFAESFSAIVFDYQDPVGTYARNATISQRLGEVHANLIARADGIIVHTDANRKSISELRNPSEVCLIRNAGNGMLLQRDGIKRSIPGFNHPVVGTVGRLSRNIDVPLLLKLADQFRSGTIVNIGTVSVERRELKAKKNVVLLPPMAAEELNMNIGNFDVGVLPYRRTIEGSPLRVYDMLSHSLQIVSTHFPDAEYFSGVVHIADSDAEFAERTGDLLSGRKNWIGTEIIEKFLLRNSWDARVGSLITFCESIVARQ